MPEWMKDRDGGTSHARYEVVLYGSGLKTKGTDSLAPLLFIILWPKCSCRNNELQSLWFSSMAITQVNSPVPQLEIALT